MTIEIHTPHTLPVDDNIPGNDYAFCVELAGQPWFTSKGAMIAYYGNIRFEPLGQTSMPAIVAARFSSPLYSNDWVLAQGQGKLILGDRGFNINSYDLDDGNLTIRASNLLAFEPTLDLKQSIVPGFLTLLGTGKFLASSNGPVMFAEPPLRIDPEALVGWADCPSPSHHFDAGWMQNFLGAAHGYLGANTGEERQFDFTGAGTVLIQSSEKVLNDGHLLRHIESQTVSLGQNSLRTLHGTIGSRLQQH
ncbi:MULTISPECIES: AIM24 family protein [unclassified Rhodococcus (in: high G+C Gram-positive bacteria)]|uniref:AIM24 family protein n=1 Tax=unclassified Rhodococcus (in: high G+C Gram-positive bacteria) TaxID=192944 RepID=UPI0033953835